MVSTYTRRGLKMRTIYAPENGGPGIARQRIIDTTQCDYIMFADADDILMPRAVEVLYTQAKLNNYDLFRTNFIHEDDEGKTLGNIMGTDNVVTWCHGKVYKVSFLRDKQIRFHPDLRLNEDAYFNLVVWYTAESKGESSEITYLWRSNKNSITRVEGAAGFFKRDPLGFANSQILALKKLYETTDKLNEEMVALTLINLYNHYMQYKFYGFDIKAIDNLYSQLSGQSWLIDFFNKLNNWVYLINRLKVGTVIEDKIIFYSETFNDWANRLFLGGKL